MLRVACIRNTIVLIEFGAKSTASNRETNIRVTKLKFPSPNAKIPVSNLTGKGREMIEFAGRK
jgi:hypothetical protein